MCESCWNRYGSPLPTEAARKAAELVDALYEVALTGGAAHIVTDDWNIEDEHITWCLSDEGLSVWNSVHPTPTSQDLEALHQAKNVLIAFQALTLEQRAAALALADGFCS